MDPDRQSFDAWLAGDRRAGEELIERHYDSVARFFGTKAGAAAEDLVQRTFLACAESRERFQGTASFRAFLFGIARNVFLEHLRGRVKDRRIEPDVGVSSVLALDPGASTLAFQRAEQRLLVSALQRLPLELQMALELFYWEELSVGELSEVLGIPPGTVKSRLFRAREELREAMETLPVADEAERQSLRVLVTGWIEGLRSRREELSGG